MPVTICGLGRPGFSTCRQSATPKKLITDNIQTQAAGGNLKCPMAKNDGASCGGGDYQESE
jgi:hypothetical protein